jgi:RHS repeat-associated protein
VSGPAQSTYSSCDNDVFATKLNAPNRVTRYTYDGLLRLIGAVESPCSAFAYGYDNVGNRTSVQVNGGTPATATYDAADQCNGWTYDLAGNLTSDGTATFVYDALNRTTSVTMGSQTRTNTYNGDGALIKQVANGTTTYYSQDLVAPLSQILQTKQGATTISLLYGMERLASKTGTTRTWYLGDALGSVRRTTTEAGVADLPIFYDPWGTVESGMVPTFGFTGEQHDTALGMVNLRARWYHTAKGTFTAYPWLTGMPAPVDVYEHRNDHIPGRSFQLWFWRRLYTEVEYDPPRQRWNDGNRSPDEQLIETILSRLKVFPFEVAINTWLAVCVEWLQWCNVEEFLVEAKKRGISIAEARDIPKHMAGMVELVYV